MAHDHDNRAYLQAAVGACQDALDLTDDGGAPLYEGVARGELERVRRQLRECANRTTVKGVNALRWLAALTPAQARVLARLYIQGGFKENAESLYLSYDQGEDHVGPEDRAYESITMGLLLLAQLTALFNAADPPGRGSYNRGMVTNEQRLPLAREETHYGPDS